MIQDELRAILIPLVRLALRKGLKIQELTSALKDELVNEAKLELQKLDLEVSVSKISMATGVHRVEAQRIIEGRKQDKDHNPVLNRIIGAWKTKKRYLTKAGIPKPLTYEGSDSEFAELASSISKDLTHYTILFELERIGAISFKDKLVLLEVNEFVPANDPKASFKLVAEDLDSLLKAAELNVMGEEQQLHLTTSFDNIPGIYTDEIKRWLVRFGARIHSEAREYLSKFDLDMNENLESNGELSAKVSFGTFSLTEIQDSKKKITSRKRGRKKR